MTRRRDGVLALLASTALACAVVATLHRTALPPTADVLFASAKRATLTVDARPLETPTGLRLVTLRTLDGARFFTDCDALPWVCRASVASWSTRVPLDVTGSFATGRFVWPVTARMAGTDVLAADVSRAAFDEFRGRALRHERGWWIAAAVLALATAIRALRGPRRVPAPRADDRPKPSA